MCTIGHFLLTKNMAGAITLEYTQKSSLGGVRRSGTVRCKGKADASKDCEHHTQ